MTRETAFESIKIALIVIIAGCCVVLLQHNRGLRTQLSEAEADLSACRKLPCSIILPGLERCRQNATSNCRPFDADDDGDVDDADKARWAYLCSLWEYGDRCGNPMIPLNVGAVQRAVEEAKP